MHSRFWSISKALSPPGGDPKAKPTRVYALINGSSCCCYQETMDIGADGQKQLLNHLGVRPAGETIAVRFENVSGGTSRTLGAISGSQWNNLGYNTW